MIGYHASHEQFAPSALLSYVQLAEKAGFGAISSSDHFYPWNSRQGQSGYAFAWLGAAMQLTAIPFSVVCAPGQRYHPAIVAQAVSTLAEMFPGRVTVALGSGEALNESITGEPWPSKKERNIRLLESAKIISALLDGHKVDHRGSVVVRNTRLYTLPLVKPLLIAAAVTERTAAWAGEWADGLITVHRDQGDLKKVVEAFRANGGNGKPVYLKVQLSFAASDAEALEGAYDQWRTNIFPSAVLSELTSVEQFEALGRIVQPDQMFGMVRISSDLQKHVEWIRKDMELGFERIILHNVNRQQEFFISEFGEKVLPFLR